MGREGHCKGITLVHACSVSATQGLPPAHGMCAFPVYTAEALGCSAGNCLRPALSCMRFPGLSCSGSGARALLKGTDSVAPVLCALPRSKQLSDQVFGEPSRCDLSPPQSLLLGFLGVQLVHFLRRMSTIQNPVKSWLAKKPTCSLLDTASLGLRLPPSSFGRPRLPVSGRAWTGPQPASSA